MLSQGLTPAHVGADAGGNPSTPTTILSWTWGKLGSSIQLSQNAREPRAGGRAPGAWLGCPPNRPAACPWGGEGPRWCPRAKAVSFGLRTRVSSRCMFFFSLCFKDSDSIGEVSRRAGLEKRVSRLCLGREPRTRLAGVGDREGEARQGREARPPGRTRVWARGRGRTRAPSPRER